MLPKTEKTKKHSSPDQLDLVESLSSEDKLRHKRRFLFITLFATTGLSFIFWTYRSLRNFSFSSFSFTLPQFTLPSTSTSTPDLNKILSDNSAQWHILVQPIESSSPIWSKNPSASFIDSNVQSIISSLKQSPPSSSNLIGSVLPEGLEIREIIDTKSDSLQYSSLISLPQKQFLVLIKNDNPNLDQFKSTVPLIVESLYWSLLNRFN